MMARNEEAPPAATERGHENEHGKELAQNYSDVRDLTHATDEQLIDMLGMEDAEVRRRASDEIDRREQAAISRVHEGGEGESEAIAVRLSSVTARAVDWLWPQKIARGKVSLIAGNPGLGKSQITASLAAIVSVGGAWPVDRTPCRPGNVVFLSAEDDAADTIVPRLEAAGADLTKIHKVEAIKAYNDEGHVLRSPSLLDDMPRLSRLIDRIGGADLVVIDPVTAFLGSGRVDSHNNSDIRGVMLSLQEFASEHHVAVVGVSHLSKGKQSQALMAVMGSIGWVAAARAAFGVFADEDSSGRRRLMLPLKNNLGDDENGLAYSIEPVTLESGIQTSRITWEADAVTKSADDVYVEDDGTKSAKDEAIEFLRDALANGPRPVAEVKAEAKEADIAPKTLRRARERIGIRATRERFDGAWTWGLPSPSSPPLSQGQDGHDGHDGQDGYPVHHAHLAQDAQLAHQREGGMTGATRRHREHIDRALVGTRVSVEQLWNELDDDDRADFTADDPPPIEALRALAKRLDSAAPTSCGSEAYRQATEGE